MLGNKQLVFPGGLTYTHVQVWNICRKPIYSGTRQIYTTLTNMNEALIKIRVNSVPLGPHAAYL